MDADNSPARLPASAQGGTVEPANRATVAKERFQTPADTAGERYELYDPFAEVTYRSRNLQEITAKAEQLGSSRFIAVAEELHFGIGFDGAEAMQQRGEPAEIV